MNNSILSGDNPFQQTQEQKFMLQLESLYSRIEEIEEQLGEEAYELDEELDDEIEEGFQGVSKTKRLIAQRKSALRKKLTQGYHYKKK